MGRKYEIFNNHVISFEMEVKIQYKDCDINIKKNDKIYVINAVIISKIGHIVEYSETFLAQNRIYPKIIDYLNNIILIDLENVYQKLIKKRNFRNKINSI